MKVIWCIGSGQSGNKAGRIKSSPNVEAPYDQKEEYSKRMDSFQSKKVLVLSESDTEQNGTLQTFMLCQV